MAVSGGYGVSASGTTNTTGYFGIAIKPTNIGGPFPLSFAITSASGNTNTTVGSITVVKNLIPTLNLQAVSSPTAVVGQSFALSATLNDQFGNPVNGTSITLNSTTDSTANFKNVYPSGPTGNSTGSLAQTSGTYAPGAVAVGITFDKTGTQTVTATASLNGQIVTATFNVYVQSSSNILANIIWGTVSPTTLQVRSSMSVSGQALDFNGNPIKNMQIQVYFKEGGAVVQTLTTDGGGYFVATLTPTGAGTKTLMAQMGNNVVQYPTNITVNPGSPATVAIQLSYTAPLLTNNDTIVANSRVQDAYGNNLPNQSVTFTASMSNSSVGGFTGGAGSWNGSNFTSTKTVLTDSNGNASATFVTGSSAGTITITAQDGSLSNTNSVTDTLAYAAKVIISQAPSQNPIIFFSVWWDWASSNPSPYTSYDRIFTLEVAEYDQKNRPYNGNTTLNVDTVKETLPISYQISNLYIQDVTNPSKSGNVGVLGNSSSNYVTANGYALWAGSQYTQPYAWTYSVPMSSGIGTANIEEKLQTTSNDGSNFNGYAYMGYTINVDGTNYYYTTK